MNYKTISTAAIPVVLGVTIFLVGAISVSAVVLPNASSTTGGSAAARIQTLISRANQEINRRLQGLQALATRIQDMQKLSGTEKDNLASSIQAQETELTALQTKVAADTDLPTLRTDLQSITKSYRIYLLVIPQGAITAATDRVLTIVDNLSIIATKLQTRITAAQSAGSDVAALQTSLTDLSTKVSDAQTQAQTAVAEISGLTPDQGDPTKLQANTQMLKDARSKLKTAMSDLQAARQDAVSIVKELKAMGGIGTTATTTSTSTTP